MRELTMITILAASLLGCAVDGGPGALVLDRAWWRAPGELRAGWAFERLPGFGGPEFPLPVDEPLTNFEAKYRIEGRARNRASWQRRSRES